MLEMHSHVCLFVCSCFYEGFCRFSECRSCEGRRLTRLSWGILWVLKSAWNGHRSSLFLWHIYPKETWKNVGRILILSMGNWSDGYSLHFMVTLTILGYPDWQAANVRFWEILSYKCEIVDSQWKSLSISIYIYIFSLA